MRLIESLAAGINGAENGSVDVYQRGTTTRAVLYEDLEGLVVAASEPQALDSHGAVTRYVNELVDIVVYLEDGTVFKNFSSGDSAPGVECRSVSFTGTSYDQPGVTGAGYPVDLKTILDRWIDSAGAIDWKVDLSGTPTNIEDAIGDYGSPLFNVKSTVYGAVGDGVTDDTAAINAAITAAYDFGGGTVVFPGGSYRINGQITVPDKVNLLGLGGLGPQQVVLKMDNDMVLSARGYYDTCSITNLYIALVGAAADSAVITIGNTGTYAFNDCILGWYVTGTLSAAGSIVAVGTTDNVTFKGCTFNVQNGDSYGVRQATYGAGSVSFLGCVFKNLDSEWGDYDTINVGIALVSGCTFDNSELATIAAASTPSHIKSTNSTVAVGNVATDPTLAGDWIFIDAASQNRVFEAANWVGSEMKLMQHSVDATDVESRICSASRDMSSYFITSNAAQTIPAETYGYVQITRTNVSSILYTIPDCYPGTKLTFCVHNTGTSALSAWTFSANVENPHAFAYTIAANTFCMFTLVAVRDDETDTSFWLIRDQTLLGI
jgi:hypothetical protein